MTHRPEPVIRGRRTFLISLRDPTDTGQGLGTDALEALLDFGFGRLRLERLWLDVYDFNKRAMRLVREGRLQSRGRRTPRRIPGWPVRGRRGDVDPP